MAMIHGDDKGLVLPPRVARLQVILIPVGVTAKTSEEHKTALFQQISELETRLKKANIRMSIDTREGYTPGYKFSDWELKGIPCRLEVGPKDIAASVVSYVRRDTGSKGTIPIADIDVQIPNLLATIQQDMYNKADSSFKSHRLLLTEWEEVIAALDARSEWYRGSLSSFG